MPPTCESRRFLFTVLLVVVCESPKDAVAIPSFRIMSERFVFRFIRAMIRVPLHFRALSYPDDRATEKTRSLSNPSHCLLLFHKAATTCNRRVMERRNTPFAVFVHPRSPSILSPRNASFLSSCPALLFSVRTTRCRAPVSKRCQNPLSCLIWETLTGKEGTRVRRSLHLAAAQGRRCFREARCAVKAKWVLVEG